MLFCTGASAISIVQLHAHEDSGFSIGGSWCVEESRIYTVQARSVCVCPSSSAPVSVTPKGWDVSVSGGSRWCCVLAWCTWYAGPS
jgi:hypothetical protein